MVPAGWQIHKNQGGRLLDGTAGASCRMPGRLGLISYRLLNTSLSYF